MEKYANKILACIKKNSEYSTAPDLLSRSEKKSYFDNSSEFEKLKGLDNPVIVEKDCMTGLQDFWLVENRKGNVATKAYLKNAADAKRKTKEKENHVKEKAKSKD